MAVVERERSTVEEELHVASELHHALKGASARTILYLSPDFFSKDEG